MEADVTQRSPNGPWATQRAYGPLAPPMPGTGMPSRGSSGSPAPRARSQGTTQVNRWLRLTSWGWDQPQDTLDVRETARRSQLLSWIVLALLVADLLLVPVGIDDPGTLGGVVIVFVSLIVSILLNRRGYVTAAGVLLVVLICLADLLSLASQPGGLPLDALPAYDLLCAAVVVAASVLRPTAAFIIAAINIMLIIGDFALQTHAADLNADIAAFPSPTIGVITLLARPIALQVMIAGIAFLWVRGALRAIQRADRAEELAALQAIIVEQKRQLDSEIAEMLRVHTLAANGDFHARVQALSQQNALWQVAMSLNNLLARIERAGAAEHQLNRTEQELARLESAIEDLIARRPPIWPAPTGTRVDRLLLLLGRVFGQGTQQQLPGHYSTTAQLGGEAADAWDPRRGAQTSGGGGPSVPPSWSQEPQDPYARG